MSRYQSYHRSKNILFLGLWLCMLRINHTHAASCRRDPVCIEAVTRAESASNNEERLNSIAELQGVYRRISDPRLLVSIGNMLRKVGQYEQARASCAQAQTKASFADMELQAQAKECLAGVNTSLQTETKGYLAPIANRVEAKSGAAHAETIIHNNINVTPNISMKPNMQISPQIHLGESTAPNRSYQSIHRYWWFWTALSGGVVIVAVIGLESGFLSHKESSLSLDDNIYRPTF